jgi:hypothetical protein
MLPQARPIFLINSFNKLATVMTDVRPPTDYTPPVGETFSKDTTIFVGLVVHGILDISTLRKGANALIQKCPVLGGQVLRKACPYQLNVPPPTLLSQ